MRLCLRFLTTEMKCHTVIIQLDSVSWVVVVVVVVVEVLGGLKVSKFGI